MKLAFLLTFLAVCGSLQIARADQLIESYSAYLSEADHFNSKGTRLTSAAAIIRQDRANYHKFGKGDEGDQTDSYFAKAANREVLEKLIENGPSTKQAIRAIVNGTPVIQVEVYRSKAGFDYVNVRVE